MKDIKAILSDSGAELTDEQVKAICDAVGENYRSKEETDKKAARIKELEEANESLAKQVEEINLDSEELESLRKSVSEYKNAEEERKAKAEEQHKRDQFMTVFDAAVGEQEFANDLIRSTVFEKVYAKCAENTGINAKDVLEEVTKDLDGVYKNPQLDPMRMPKPEDMKSGNADSSVAKSKKALAAQLFGQMK